MTLPKFQTTKLLILLRLYFHDVLEQLKSNIYTSFCSKWVPVFVFEFLALLRDVAFT